MNYIDSHLGKFKLPVSDKTYQIYFFFFLGPWWVWFKVSLQEMCWSLSIPVASTSSCLTCSATETMVGWCILFVSCICLRTAHTAKCQRPCEVLNLLHLKCVQVCNASTTWTPLTLSRGAWAGGLVPPNSTSCLNWRRPQPWFASTSSCCSPCPEPRCSPTETRLAFRQDK